MRRALLLTLLSIGCSDSSAPASDRITVTCPPALYTVRPVTLPLSMRRCEGDAEQRPIVEGSCLVVSWSSAAPVAGMAGCYDETAQLGDCEPRPSGGFPIDIVVQERSGREHLCVLRQRLADSGAPDAGADLGRDTGNDAGADAARDSGADTGADSAGDAGGG